ncbi:MAG: ATP-binding cassette domain-containing protein [Chlamydiae bacterium]|nr:ATP-binding cassette domain-containing protein [Chlamydiota bacterium]
MTEKPLLQVKNLKKYFPSGKGTLKAIDDVSFTIYEGETLGLVGESGCGKSTLGKVLLKLEEPTGGEIHFQDINITNMNPQEMKKIRRQMQIIFQDPYASLNPRMTISDIIAEPLEIHKVAFGNEKMARIDELLNIVGLSRSTKSRFPHELSGGQRQRVGIARSLSLNPRFLVCDEPISALDVSVQAQIINLLKKLQKDIGLTYLFIAHDLGVVKYLSSRVAVMYLGKIVELASSNDLYSSPMHPYTQALLSAIPIPDPHLEKSRKKVILQGEMPSPITPPKGCVFCTRCPSARKECFEVRPIFKEVAPQHFAACHLYNLP